ncbi:MAG: phosphoribosylformylglycinamidine synthase subunit PurS [Methanoregulaceae archaeon]|nr:phosphoribosylformylglycinamidine synthase subunit PurS [Methanoregulaceae archaeon]
MEFSVRITISLKEGMLDPEATTIRNALANLGFSTGELKTARLFYITFDAKNKQEAEEQARKMCERLLANPVIHRFTIEAC